METALVGSEFRVLPSASVRLATRARRQVVDMTLLRDSLPAMAGGRPVRDTFLTFGAPLIGREEIEEVLDTLRSGWIGFGPKCLRLETEFARYVRASHAISLSSCTAGLHLALIAAGVGPGDEVITSALTFPATANVIEHVGATPVFVDVDHRTQNIDTKALAAAVTSQTKAVIPVHMAGRPCDMDAICGLAERHGLTIVEDAAHAVEAAWRDKKVGSASRFTSFSFYATKNMTTAEGGMLTTNDSMAAECIRTLRLHGLSRDAWQRYAAGGNSSYDTLLPGYKYNLTDLQASLGLHQLARLEKSLVVRQLYWRLYDAGFDDLGTLVDTPAPEGSEERHARHLYTIMLNRERLRIGRDQFVMAMRAENIGVGVHFTPVHLHSYYRQKYGFREGMYPVAEAIGRSTVSLPMSAKLTPEDVRDVVSAVRKVLTYHDG